jgi:hypothetical protein
MQAKDVLIPARREELLDDFGVKWPDLFLMAFLADGIREMYALRSDLLLASDGSMGSSDPYVPDDNNSHVRIVNGRLQIKDTVSDEWISVEFQDGALALIRPAVDPEVAAATVRMSDGHLQLWDTVLEQWLAVEFQDGALAVLQSDGDGEKITWFLDSMEADIGVSDSQLRFPLQEYVVYRALNVFAETVEETNKAETHLAAFHRGLGVRR